MSGNINTFHHLGIVARDLAATVTQCERLGFMFTPLSFPEFPLSPGGPPEQVGVANRRAIFRNGYLEMLGVSDADRWASISKSQRGPFDIDRPLERYEGLYVMHFGTENLDGVRENLVAQGLNPSASQPFQRTVETPEGSAMMRARRLSFAPEASPEALFQIVQHETPQQRYMAHPNGARELTEAILCVEDPKEVAGGYARYAGHPVTRRGDLLVLDLGEARLVVLDRETLEAVLPGEEPPTLPYLAGLAVSADLDHAAKFLCLQKTAFLEHAGRIIISARDAGGCAVAFEQLSKQR
jgi:hypothetical protein